MPFSPVEAARKEPNWHLRTSWKISISSAGLANGWWFYGRPCRSDRPMKYSTHGHVRGEEFYPHDLAAYAELSRQLGEYDGR